ncbi:MAG: hypothetical protein A3F11_12080 [Gammaproteobacteria bacterium RIFCSPHIGHO2_12_FULL_37_14]|nr:MAG: hypothetical protein A3F11_12080 [Gammaproteobacteria bacterium RIFCSPHIGHO2_12_FULL_37_14]
MWLQRFTNYILYNRWQTIALVFFGTFIPIFGMIGILIATLVTLRKNIIEGAILVVAATVPYAISFYFSDHYHKAAPIAMWAAISVAILSNVLTWIFAVMLRQRSSWSQILQIAALLGVLVISVIHLVYPDITDWWGTQLQSYYHQALATPGLLKSHIGSSEVQLETINATKQYATGLIVVGILFNAILQLIFARWWQAIIFQPRSLHKELQNIRLSQLAGILFAASLVLSYLGNSVVLDIMPVLYMLFGMAGLSLIHCLFKLMRSPSAWFWLLVFYMILIFSLPISIIMVAVLALFDVWLDIRNRFKKLNLR